MNIFNRTELLIGNTGLEKLKNSTVAIFGIGGVGSYAVEALARSGIGNIVLIDHDIIDETNINRQLHATIDTIGLPKVQVMKDRILKINPELNVVTYQSFFDEENKDTIFDNLSKVDYIIDAIDSIASKVSLCVTATTLNIPIISSMGAGNKLDPTKFQVTDIYKTSVDPIAKIMRKELKNYNVPSLKVVFSTEEPIKIKQEGNKKQIPGSISFIPSVVGLILAGEVIKNILQIT